MEIKTKMKIKAAKINQTIVSLKFETTALGRSLRDLSTSKIVP